MTLSTWTKPLRTPMAPMQANMEYEFICYCCWGYPQSLFRTLVLQDKKKPEGGGDRSAPKAISVGYKSPKNSSHTLASKPRGALGRAVGNCGRSGAYNSCHQQGLEECCLVVAPSSVLRVIVALIMIALFVKLRLRPHKGYSFCFGRDASSW